MDSQVVTDGQLAKDGKLIKGILKQEGKS